MRNILMIFISTCIFIAPAFAQTPADMKKADQMAINGRVLYSEGRFQAAIEVLQNAVNINPTNGVAVYYLAMSHIRLGETDTAISLLESYSAKANNKDARLSSLDKQYYRQNQKLLRYAKTKLKK